MDPDLVAEAGVLAGRTHNPSGRGSAVAAELLGRVAGEVGRLAELGDPRLELLAGFKLVNVSAQERAGRGCSAMPDPTPVNASGRAPLSREHGNGAEPGLMPQ